MGNPISDRLDHRHLSAFTTEQVAALVREHHQGGTMIRTIVTIGLLVAAVLYLYWLGAFDLPISIARWWIGGHGRR